MSVFVSVLLIVLSVLLVLVVMIQNSKGGGVDQSFGVSNQLGGASKSTEVVERITWYLAGAIAVFSLVSVLYFSTPQTSNSLPSTGIKTQS